MKAVINEIVYIMQAGLLRGWPGRPCPHCKTRPKKKHKPGCPTGAWDGGTWA